MKGEIKEGVGVFKMVPTSPLSPPSEGGELGRSPIFKAGHEGPEDSIKNILDFVLLRGLRG